MILENHLPLKNVHIFLANCYKIPWWRWGDQATTWCIKKALESSWHLFTIGSQAMCDLQVEGVVKHQREKQKGWFDGNMSSFASKKDIMNKSSIQRNIEGKRHQSTHWEKEKMLIGRMS